MRVIILVLVVLITSDLMAAKGATCSSIFKFTPKLTLIKTAPKENKSFFDKLPQVEKDRFFSLTRELSPVLSLFDNNLKMKNKIISYATINESLFSIIQDMAHVKDLVDTIIEIKLDEANFDAIYAEKLELLSQHDAPKSTPRFKNSSNVYDLEFSKKPLSPQKEYMLSWESRSDQHIKAFLEFIVNETSEKLIHEINFEQALGMDLELIVGNAGNLYRVLSSYFALEGLLKATLYSGKLTEGPPASRPVNLKLINGDYQKLLELDEIVLIYAAKYTYFSNKSVHLLSEIFSSSEKFYNEGFIDAKDQHDLLVLLSKFNASTPEFKIKNVNTFFEGLITINYFLVELK